MSIQAEGQYSAGTIGDGGFLPAGSFDKMAEFPADGEHLVIDVMNTGIEWSLHSVCGHKSSGCGGNARIEQGGNGERVLVLDSPIGSGGSALLPGGPLDPDRARAFLADMMRGLPDWQTAVVLPSELRRELRRDLSDWPDWAR